MQTCSSGVCLQQWVSWHPPVHRRGIPGYCSPHEEICKLLLAVLNVSFQWKIFHLLSQKHHIPVTTSSLHRFPALFLLLMSIVNLGETVFPSSLSLLSGLSLMIYPFKYSLVNIYLPWPCQSFFLCKRIEKPWFNLTIGILHFYV